MSYKWLVLAILLLARATQAATHKYIVPLHDGKANAREFNAPISRDLHLLNCPTSAELDFGGPAGTDALCAMNACLWRGCTIEVYANRAIVQLDDLPAESLCRRMSRMTRIIAAEKYPAASAAQARRWGLSLPERLDPTKPLVVLIHGLDADRNNSVPMADLLRKQGFQVAYFCYPGDQPIEDSAALLARSMRDLRIRFPFLRLDFVAHSMGGLVAREYVEGPDYAGGVDRLILVAPPNRGSSWAHLRIVLSAQENYYLRRDEPDWRWTWLITEGMGEAGSDLLPGSDFLSRLNHRPRRPGVKYTIIAGNKSDVSLVKANAIDSLSRWIPTFARTWWGIGRCYRGLQSTAEGMRTREDDSDGPVSLASAKLDGVTDFVVVPADHRALYLPDGGKPPAAWAVVRERLTKN